MSEPRAGGPTPGESRPGGPETRGGAPEQIGTVLRRVMRGAGPAAARRQGRLVEAWNRAAGPDLAADTRPTALQHGVLVVEARSSALVAELQAFRREELLSRLLAADPTGRVTGLKFRLGVF